LFVEWLQAHFPDRSGHVMSLVRQASGGRDYDNRFGRRQTGRGAYADMLGARFRAACRRLGLDGERYQESLDRSQFEPPGAPQLGLDLGYS
jgi:DNA repair photolyase